MSISCTHHNRSNPSSNIISRWRQLQLQLNTHTPITYQHTRCEPAFLNTFGDLPGWIDHSTTLRLVTQNVQGIKPNDNDDKLQSGIVNLVALQAGIACPTETNVEWRNFICIQGYNDAFTKLYSASRQLNSTSFMLIALSLKKNPKGG
jgi:hypothetical protein